VSLFIARWTYAMRRLSICCLWLQGMSKRSASEVGQCISLLLSIPCFKLSHLCFKATYFFQQRELVRLGRKCARLGGEDSLHVFTCSG